MTRTMRPQQNMCYVAQNTSGCSEIYGHGELSGASSILIFEVLRFSPLSPKHQDLVHDHISALHPEHATKASGPLHVQEEAQGTIAEAIRKQ